MPENALSFSAALGLIKDYDVLINGLWSLYAAVLAAVLTVLNTKWRAKASLLAGAFAVFALGNAHALYIGFNTKKQLVAHAATLTRGGAQTLQDIVQSLSPSPVWGMLAFHALLDLAVIAVIFIIAGQAANAEAPSKIVNSE